MYTAARSTLKQNYKTGLHFAHSSLQTLLKTWAHRFKPATYPQLSASIIYLHLPKTRWHSFLALSLCYHKQLFTLTFGKTCHYVCQTAPIFILSNCEHWPIIDHPDPFRFRISSFCFYLNSCSERYLQLNSIKSKTACIAVSHYEQGCWRWWSENVIINFFFAIKLFYNFRLGS